MIQILLLILKIIGITLLILLGLVFLVLALVLFVPVFYRIRVVHNPEKTQVNGRVRFLFPLLSVTFQYLKKITYRVRVLGFSALDSEKPKKEKADKEKPKKEKKKRQRRTGKVSDKTEPKLPLNVHTVEKKKKEEMEPGTGETVSGQPSKRETAAKEENTPKTGFFEKIRVKIQKLRETVISIINKVKKLLHQKDEVQRILNKPESKQAIAFAWDKLKRLLKHILPGKMKGYVAYGADNPATTGQVLGIISMVYAKTGMILEIRPNFEEPQLECDVELKGRVQLFTLLVIAVKVFLNQELRQLITELKNVKNIE